ncbi:MAG: penicillin-binding protein 2, partial [Alphaproteobacteria bacterium]
EAAQARPIPPERWSEPYVMRVAFGHSIAVTPVHLAAAYATLVNGGLRVRPTLLRDAAPPGEEDRVIAPAISRAIRAMLRKVVTEGTGKGADVPGYLVGGKTGSAEKVGPGGYQHDRLLSTFAAVFPVSDPQYVLVISLDEPEIFAAGRMRRTAGWTAAPLAGLAIARLAPLLGLRPKPEIAPERDAPALMVRR